MPGEPDERTTASTAALIDGANVGQALINSARFRSAVLA